MRLYSSFATREFGDASLMGFQNQTTTNQRTNRHWIIPAISQPPKKNSSIHLHHWYITNIEILQTCHASFVGFYSWYGRHLACKKAWISLNGVKLPLTQPMDQGNQKFGNFIFPYEKIRHSQKPSSKLPAWLSEWSTFMTQNKWLLVVGGFNPFEKY